MRITRHKNRHASLKHNSGLQLRASPQPNRFRYHFTHPSRWRLMWPNDTQRIPNDTPLMFEVVWMPKLYKHAACMYGEASSCPHITSWSQRHHGLPSRPLSSARPSARLGHWATFPSPGPPLGWEMATDGGMLAYAGCIWKRLGLISLISLWWDPYIFLWDLSQLFLEGHLHWETNPSKRAVHLREESCFSSKLPVQVQLVSPHKWLNRSKPRQVAADATGSSAAAWWPRISACSFPEGMHPIAWAMDRHGWDGEAPTHHVNRHILVTPSTRRPPSDAQPAEPSVITTLQTLLPFSPSFLCEAQQLLLSFQE